MHYSGVLTRRDGSTVFLSQQDGTTEHHELSDHCQVKINGYDGHVKDLCLGAEVEVSGQPVTSVIARQAPARPKQSQAKPDLSPKAQPQLRTKELAALKEDTLSGADLADDLEEEDEVKTEPKRIVPPRPTRTPTKPRSRLAE